MGSEDENTTFATAAILAIGDELLNGRTRDKNIHHLARFLDHKGIELKQVRIVADDMTAIGEAVNALRTSHTYLFTSGGIGPTHDDITVDAISAALGVDVIVHPQAFDLLKNWYAERNIEFTPARQRMARTPDGADLITNPVSMAPGIMIENIFIMAGVPSVFNAMVDEIEPTLTGGKIVCKRVIECPLGEGSIGDGLGEIAANHKSVSIGSYPRFDGEKFTTQIVLRSRDEIALEKASDAVNGFLEECAR